MLNWLRESHLNIHHYSAFKILGERKLKEFLSVLVTTAPSCAFLRQNVKILSRTKITVVSCGAKTATVLIPPIMVLLFRYFSEGESRHFINPTHSSSFILCMHNKPNSLIFFYSLYAYTYIDVSIFYMHKHMCIFALSKGCCQQQ